MKKFGFYFTLFAMVGFLGASVWAGPTALSDADMDGVFAQGIVIQNQFTDDDTFKSTQTQTNLNHAGNYQSNTPTNTTMANADEANGGEAQDAYAYANGGDATAFGLGIGVGGDDEDGIGVGVGLAVGGFAAAKAKNEGGDAYNTAFAYGKNYDKNFGVNYFKNKNYAFNYQYDKNYVYQKIELIFVAIASDWGIAYQDVDGDYLQSQTNGPDSFNNTQNQLYGEAHNDAPAINTEVYNKTYAKAYADGGFAYSSEANADAYNKNKTLQVPVAVSAAANLGASVAATYNKAYADGGENDQELDSRATNVGLAAAKNKAKSTALGLGLGLSNAGSQSGDAFADDEGGLALSASQGGLSLAPFYQNTETGDIDQAAAALNYQDANSGDVLGLQDASADAEANAHTLALLDQDATAGDAYAKAYNENDQDADAYAASIAQNNNQAMNDDIYTITYIHQMNAVKSVVAYDQGENSGVINNAAQGAISAQQINAMPISSAAFAGPVNMGNAVAVNGIFN